MMNLTRESRAKSPAAGARQKISADTGGKSADLKTPEDFALNVRRRPNNAIGAVSFCVKKPNAFTQKDARIRSSAGIFDLGAADWTAPFLILSFISAAVTADRSVVFVKRLQRIR